MILEDGPLFIADTQVHPEPTPEQIAETAIASARHVRRFGLVPKIALCSHSQFGNLDYPTGRKMRKALDILDQSRMRLRLRGGDACGCGAGPGLEGADLSGRAGSRGRRTCWSSPTPMPPQVSVTC